MKVIDQSIRTVSHTPVVATAALGSIVAVRETQSSGGGGMNVQALPLMATD